MIVAPLARVIPVVAPPLIESYESIVDANVVASIVVSVTAIVVRPVSLLNSLLPIAVAKVPRSLRVLPASAVTFVRSTANAVAALIVFSCSAVAAVASADLITIVRSLVPPSALNVASSVTVSDVAIVAVNFPVVVAPNRFAVSTEIGLVTVIT